MIIDFHTHVFPPRIKKNRNKYIDSDPCFAILYSRKDAKLATAELMQRHGLTAKDIERAVRSVIKRK
ncbi:hypothetical protein ES703_99519 [subsurface metagenome]